MPPAGIFEGFDPALFFAAGTAPPAIAAFAFTLFAACFFHHLSRFSSRRIPPRMRPGSSENTRRKLPLAAERFAVSNSERAPLLPSNHPHVRPAKPLDARLCGARPIEQRKGADRGIDGRLYFHEASGGLPPDHLLRQGRLTSASPRFATSSASSSAKRLNRRLHLLRRAD